MQGCFEHNRASQPFPKWVFNDFKSSFSKFCHSVKANDHIVYSDLDYFKEYEDKTVLIIGGGPSTNKLDYNTTERDFTWACNHFYLNPRFKSIKVDLAMLMAEPNLKSKEFIEYRENFEPYLGFEVHPRWFDYEFDNYEKYFAMHTKFYARLGVCPRMILFACFLKCREIKFVGLDGYEPIYKGDHAHEPGKKTLPGIFTEELFDKQYKFFWKYTRELFPDIEFINLGEGNKFHK